MTKKKGIASKLFIGLTGLTLLSCCFLGTTFARYTSGETGSATTNVALWDVEFTSDGTQEINNSVSFDKLSPSAADWQDNVVRYNTSDIKLIGVIRNNSDVSAKIEITYDATEADFTMNGDVAFVTGSGSDQTAYSWSTNEVVGDGVTEAQAEALFSMKLYANTDGSSANNDNFIESGYTTTLAAQGGVVYIFAQIVWTSATDSTEGAEGKLADAIDTWVGENVESVQYDFDFTATQASTRPDATFGE